MKVLYFMNHADQGGAYLALYDLLVELKNNHPEIEPIVVTGKKNNLNKKLTELGVENYYAPFKNFISSYKKPKWLFRFLLKIRYYFFKPFAIKKIESLIDFGEIDIIHSNLDRVDIGVYFAKKYNIRHIWHVREHLDDDFVVTSVFNNYIKYMNKFNSEYIFISESVKNKWISRGLIINKYDVIYDGVIENMLVKNPIVNNSDPKFVFLGGYAKNKGQEYLIDKLSMLPTNIKKDLIIDFFGNGEKKYIEFLRKKAEKNNLIGLNFYGYDSDIYSKLSLYDFGFNCSNCEGFGRITVEYMLSGLCPIVSNTGANIEIIDDKINGFVFNYNDNSLCDIIKLLFENKIDLSKIKNNARTKSINYYTMKNHADKIYNYYNKGVD